MVYNTQLIQKILFILQKLLLFEETYTCKIMKLESLKLNASQSQTLNNTS